MGLMQKTWTLSFTPEAQKAFKKLDSSLQKEIFRFFYTKVLKAEDPFVYAKPLRQNLSSFYRYRIGSYRVICNLDRNKLVITVFKTGHRRDVYD